MERIIKTQDCEGMGWIPMAQNRYQWRALANTVITISNSKKLHEFDQLSKYQLLNGFEPLVIN